MQKFIQSSSLDSSQICWFIPPKRKLSESTISPVRRDLGVRPHTWIALGDEPWEGLGVCLMSTGGKEWATSPWLSLLLGEATPVHMTVTTANHWRCSILGHAQSQLRNCCVCAWLCVPRNKYAALRKNDKNYELMLMSKCTSLVPVV